MALEFNLNFDKAKKLSKDQQYIILLILGSGIFLGGAIAVLVNSFSRISFNAKVIMSEDQAIDNYSNAIKNYGVCQKPSGKTYTESEIKNCHPDSVELSQVPNTLRSNILENLATNSALNSVPKENSSSCINPVTEKVYTSEDLAQAYRLAKTDEERNQASRLIRTCSAIRVIPDALPSTKNEEALLASLDRIFRLSGWEPNSLSPSGESGVADFGNNLNSLQVNLSVETDVSTAVRILGNIERSIRNFNITKASIEWQHEDSLSLRAQASAFYMDSSRLMESTKTVSGGSK